MKQAALLPAALVAALSLLLALTHLQPAIERNRLMLAWLDLAPLSGEPHRVYQAPLADATIAEFRALAGRLDALCRASAGRAGAVCWRAEMARLVAGVQPGRPPQFDTPHLDAARQMMLAHVAGDVAYADGRVVAAVLTWSQHLPPSALIYKAEALLAQADSRTAIELLNRLERRRYDQPEGDRLAGVLVELANAALGAGNFIDAESYWRWAIVQSPGRDNYYVGLGRSLAGQRRWDEAAAAYRDAIQLAPDKAQHYLRLARALVQAGQADEAVLALRRAHQLEPNNATVQRLLTQLEQD